jgi:hypothetical protein
MICNELLKSGLKELGQLNGFKWLEAELSRCWTEDIWTCRLHRFTRACAFFITCARSNTQFYRREPQTVDKRSGVRSDQIIVLNGSKPRDSIPMLYGAFTSSILQQTCASFPDQ